MEAERRISKKVPGADQRKLRWDKADSSSAQDFFPPWQPWSDSELNRINWDLHPTLIRNLSTGSGAVKMKANDSARDSGLKAVKNAAASPRNIEIFEDPMGHGQLPPDMNPVVWSRPNYNPEAPLHLDPEIGGLDLYTNNQHLLQYRVMRNIIAAVMGLERAGNLFKFEVNQKDAPFSIGSEDSDSWKPWFHVYALTLAGDKFPHSPRYNPSGLYFVRLFYMGLWRKVAVDDYFPYDADGRLLLPCSYDPKCLWMPLLTKALLKIAALSWTNYDVTLDFDPIPPLIGWVNCSMDVDPTKANDTWRILQANKRDDAKMVQKRKNHLKFIELLETDKVDEDLGCLRPCYNHAALLTTSEEDEIPELPSSEKWREIRWAKRALEEGHIRGMPGTVRNIVELFIPLKKSPPNSGEIQKVNTFLFEKIAPSIRRIHFYFAPSFFEFLKVIEEPNLSEAGDSFYVCKLNNIKKYPTTLEFAGSDTLFCKNFLITLTVLNPHRTMPAGHVRVESWDWKSSDSAAPWFTLRTCNTNSRMLCLGPGIQILKIWFSTPHLYRLSILSKTPFITANEEAVTTLAAKDSTSLSSSGEKLAEVFGRLIRVEVGGPRHAEIFEEFLNSFCPPVYICPSIPGSVASQYVMDIRQLSTLFESKFMEMLLKTAGGKTPVTIGESILNYQKLFLDPKFGEKYLADNGLEDIFNEIKRRKEEDSKDYLIRKYSRHDPKSPVTAEVIELDKLSCLHTKLKTFGMVIGGESDSETNRKPSTNKLGKVSSTEKPERTDWSHFLVSPLKASRLLREMVIGTEDLLQKYMFCQDEVAKLSYYDFTSLTEMTLFPTDWVVLGRVVLNVHSLTPVPVGFHVTSTVSPVSLILYNLDTNEKVMLGLNFPYTCYIEKNELGYAALVVGRIKPEGRETSAVPWRLRVIGTRPPDVPHVCCLSLFAEPRKSVSLTSTISRELKDLVELGPRCSGSKGPDPNLTAIALRKEYKPVPSNTLGRYTLSLSNEMPQSAALVSMYIKTSFAGARLLMRITGKNGSVVIEKQGIGEVVLPALYLTRSSARQDLFLTEFTYFIEFSVVGGSWPLTENEIADISEGGAILCFWQCNIERTFLDIQAPVSVTAADFWNFVVIVDSDQKNYITISESRDFEATFTSGLKRDPGRSERGKKLREDFLLRRSQAKGTPPDTLQQLYEKFKNPDENPDEEQKVIRLNYIPVPPNVPKRFGAFSGDSSEEDVQEEQLGEGRYLRLVPRMHLALHTIGDGPTEQALAAISAWADRKMKRAYDIRDQVMTDRKKGVDMYTETERMEKVSNPPDKALQKKRSIAPKKSLAGGSRKSVARKSKK